MSDEVNNLIQAGRLAHDIGKDLFDLVKELLEKKKSNLDVEYTEDVVKNSKKKTAILVGDNPKGTVYIDDSINRVKSGESSIEEEAERITKFIEMNVNDEGMKEARDLANELENPDKSKIHLQVVNSELNKDLLEKAPHMDICGDLSLIARYRFNDNASTIITDLLASHMGLTGQEVLEAGQINAKHEQYTVKNMGEMIAEMMGGMPMDEATEMFPQEQQMLVVTNESKVHGATGIFTNPELREEVAEKLGGSDFWILPSSLHEVICVPKDSISLEDAQNMVNEVNHNELLPEEILSSSVYGVNAHTLKVTNPFQKEDMKEIAGTVRKAAAGR